MKKVLSLLLAVCLCIGMIGCGGESEKDKRIAELQEENDKLKERVTSTPAETPEEPIENKPAETVSETPKSPPDVKQKEEDDAKSHTLVMGEPFSVSTENGNYSITINEIRTLDSAGLSGIPDGNKIIVLAYTVDNIDYKLGDSINGIFVDKNSLQMSGENKTLLETYGLIPGDLQHPDTVAPGYNQRAAISFLANEGVNAVDVIFSRMGEAAATMHVDL